MACNAAGGMEARLNQFKKILLLNTITADIAELASEYGLDHVLSLADASCGIIPEGDFDTVVDTENVHESLAALTVLAERRYAFTVLNFIRQIPIGIDAVRELLIEEGEKNSAAEDANVPQIWEHVRAHILDGMPCDKTVEIFKQTDSEVVWNVVIDTHKDIWKDEEGDISVYNDLMGYFITGMVKNAGYEYSTPFEGLHSIKKI